MAYFHGVKVKIMGLMHAGSWTETDYVAAMQDWAKYIEMGWLRFIDKVFVGSDWIKSELTSKGRITKYGHVIKTGLPFDPQYCFNKAPYIEWDKRPGIVVFAGRLDDEKQPWLFDQLEKEFSKWSKNVRFIKTMEKGYTKKEYYKLLSQSRVMFSSALQENFGYAALECATYGVNLVVPDRLSYREMYPDKYRYKEFSDAVKMVDKFLFEDNTEELMDIALKHKYNVTRIVSQIE
jgi:glycosyltransferase involved in cell wall biosynthesis